MSTLKELTCKLHSIKAYQSACRCTIWFLVKKIPVIFLVGFLFSCGTFFSFKMLFFLRKKWMGMKPRLFAISFDLNLRKTWNAGKGGWW